MPGVSVGQDLGRSPVRLRTNAKYESPKQSTEVPRSTSPFYNIARPPAVGRGASLTQSPSNKAYLDPSTASFGDSLDFQNSRGRPMEMGQFGTQRFAGTGDMGGGRHLGAMLAGAMETEEQGTLRRGRGLSNSRGIVPAAELLGTSVSSAGRSESLPPQQRANSTPPYNPDQAPPTNGSGYPAYTHMPTSHGGNVGLPIQAPLYPQGRYSDLNRETRDAEMLAQVRQLSVEDDSNELYQGRQRPAYTSYSQTPPGPSGLGYASHPQFGELSHQRHPAQGSSPWSPDDGLYRGQEQYEHGGVDYADSYADRLRPYERSGAMSPGEDYNRRSLGSPYYPATGTPPVDGFRSPSRGGGGSASRPIQPGQSALHPDQLRKQLLATQQQQQQGHHPAQMTMRDSYRPYPGSAPYDYGGIYPNAPANVRMQMPSFSGSMSPLIGATPGPRRHEDFGSLRSVLLEEFRSNSKSNKRYELKVNKKFEFF
jgi:mRNA-binding protein PUF3